MTSLFPSLLSPLAALWQQALSVWISGGSSMFGLALDGFVLFALGIHIRLKLKEKNDPSVSEPVWRHWINHPDERRGIIGGLLNQVDGAKTLEQMSAFFQELQTSELGPVERDLKVMKVCVAAAPLIGLFGTVTGMLATFGALASGSGGEKTMALIASGIFEALITTETGLVLALPGIFFQYQLAREHDRYKAFLARLETACSQKLHKAIRQMETAA